MSDLIQEKRVYTVVLTGGPCGGKTTGQVQLSNFFENLGWKVLRVPETVSIFLRSGIKISDLREELQVAFHHDLINTMIQIENMFHRIANGLPDQNILIICDRGVMDPSAYISKQAWETILRQNQFTEVDLRDTRYDQVIHLITAANGAENFYSIGNNPCRSEDIHAARALDGRTSQAWIGHPNFEIINNSTDFQSKINRMIQSVCKRVGVNLQKFENTSKKFKFLVLGPLRHHEGGTEFPVEYRDFSVVYDYLSSSDPNVRARLRKRGTDGAWTYLHTIRRPVEGQSIEHKSTISKREYYLLMSQRDTEHLTVHMTRRCFLYHEHYFQLDIYNKPCHSRCNDLVLLETYSCLTIAQLRERLPPFLSLGAEVSGDPQYSMFNLSLKRDWENNELFSNVAACRSSGSGIGVNVNDVCSEDSHKDISINTDYVL